MYIPRKSHLRTFVDVIARCGNDPNYAPIVRQGNHLLIGFEGPPDTWTTEFSEFFRALSSAMQARRAEPFVKAKWEITKPGTYALELAPGHSTEELPGRAFHFRFAKPTAFSAVLKHKGSKAMMLILYGKHGQRKDAEQGEMLEISTEITAEALREAGDAYWQLGVTNFDELHKAECTLTIEYKE